MIKSYIVIPLSRGRLAMRNAHPLSVTLPHDMAAMVKAKVAFGEYATESEIIRDGLRALQARDEAVKNWLKDQVAKSYDEFVATPANGIPADDIMAHLREIHRNRRAKTAGG
jgi:putative addiction module CopG family antidote